MRDLIFGLHKDGLRTQRSFFYGVFCTTLLLSLGAFGESTSLTPQIMSAQIKWTIGPATAILATPNSGEIAELNVPAGYRFTDAAGARLMLQRMRNPVPPGLVGLIAPENGANWAVFEYAETGYISPDSTERIDAAAILNSMWNKVEIQNSARTKEGVQPIKSVTWAHSPEFNTTNNSLSCAVRIQASSEAFINQSIRFLGRKGILAVTSIQKATGAAGAFPLAEMVNHLAFKEGQRYEDFREGDKLADTDIYQLLTGDTVTPPLSPKGWRVYVTKANMIWAVGSLGVCIFVLVIYLVSKEIRSLNPQRTFKTASAPNGMEPKERKSRRLANRTDSSDRRRAFDYQKYYSDMMMQVSTRSYVGLPLKQNEEVVEEINEAAAPLPASLVEISDVQKSAASELIARQKDFIEEQRRLMQQQTKLIEERSKLIEEKNQLLAKQSEMMENHLL